MRLIVFQPQRSSEINILMGCVLMMNFWNICTYFHGKYFTINRRRPIWMISKILEFTFLSFPARPLFTFTFILTFRPEDQPRVRFWSTRRTVAWTVNTFSLWRSFQNPYFKTKHSATFLLFEHKLQINNKFVSSVLIELRSQSRSQQFHNQQRNVSQQ